MINLCLVVIATQFSETKKRETERMIAERRRFSRSTSTLLSDSANEPGSCWEEFLKYLGHLLRKSKRRVVKKYTKFKNNRKKVALSSSNILNIYIYKFRAWCLLVYFYYIITITIECLNML